MRKIWTRIFAISLLLTPAVASAQGLLVDTNPDRQFRLPRPIIRPTPRPVPATSYKIKTLTVNAKLSGSVAKVQVSQSFVNTGSRQMEVCFVFPLPYDGAVDGMTLMVDGKEYAAKLLSAKQARSLYEAIVRRNRDPALLEWAGTGMLKTSVFPVPPGAERTVTFRYTQLCRAGHGLTDFIFPLSTAKYTSHPVEHLSVNIAIQSEREIKNVYSPTHSVKIERPSPRSATVKLTAANQVPSSDFRLFYDMGDDPLGARVLSYRPHDNEDGYFLMLLGPPIKAPKSDPISKTIIFVVDRSGSMDGKKIEQAKGALKFVLNNLHEGDLFNVIAYDSTVESFRPELEQYDEKSRQAALGFVEGLYAGGSTNIDGALKAALAQLSDTGRPSYVIFLTDGLPTAGQTGRVKIVENSRQGNKVRARMFCFGVGYDVNSLLLDKLSRANYGQSQYVSPNEDIEDHVSRLYEQIDSPVMTDVAIQFDMDGRRPDAGPLVRRVYPGDAQDLFAGQQHVAVGRYKQHGAAKVTVSGTVGDSPSRFDFPAQFVARSNDETYAFIEKLWAMRRVGEIIDQIDLHGTNKELVDELVALSTQHGVLTPYTSFLADESSDRRDLAEGRRRAELSLQALKRTAGKSGFAQRRAKSDFRQATKPPVPGLTTFSDAEEDQKVTVQTVQNVGRKTFFRRAGQWVDTSLTAEQERAVVKIERYSQQYFDLITQYGKDVAKYLAIDEPVMVELEGQAYSF